MPLNIAHRGFSSRFPENTMLAFSEAEKAGCSGIELDVHLTRDGIPVVIHDENIRRTTDGEGLVGSFSLSELRSFNASASWNGEHPFQSIPSLEEYFQWVRGTDLMTNIELKNSIIDYPGLEEKVIGLIRRYSLEDRILFSSFNHVSMQRCKRLAPEIPCGLLYSCWLVNPGAYAAGLGVECLHPRFTSLTDETLEEIHRHNIRINAWTVNEEAHISLLMKQKIDGLITNYPDRVNKFLLEH